MNIAFAGTPEFAAVALRALIDAGLRVPLVLTQPDRPAGRGMQPRASAVKQLALAHRVPVAQPRSLRVAGKYPEDARAAQAALTAAAPDVLVVAAYGLILPAWVLALPRLGCLNIHASVLPRWRGAAPIQRAIEAGDSHTGITIMQMDAGLDTGDILLAERVAIGPQTTAGGLHDELAALGGRLLIAALQQAGQGALAPMPQPAEGATYANKITKAEATIDWHLPAAVIARRVRAFNPFPGARGVLDGKPIKVWQAELAAGAGAGTDAAVGQILAADARGIAVACGEGVLRLTELQRAGGKRLPADQFLAGWPVAPGQRFVVAAAARP